MSALSPRIEALTQELAGDDAAAALERFWAEVAERGAPLIEAVPDKPDRRIVTFLWRQPDGAAPENVLAVALLASADFADMRLTRLGSSDVWYRSHIVRSNVRTVYQMATNDSLVPFYEDPDLLARMRNWTPDPLNPRTFDSAAPTDKPDGFRRLMSVLELPDAEPMPWFERAIGIPTGSVEQHRFASELLGNERDVWLYLPPGYDPAAEPYGLLLLFDGAEARYVLDAPGTLDALLAAGRIPPLVALMVSQVNRNDELPPNDRWVQFLADELLPWLHGRAHVSRDPARRIVSGLSYGGLCSAWCGLQRPDLFGNVLSQSGSFWWKPDPFERDNPAVPGDAFEYEWLTGRYIAAPQLPLRFYLDVGTLEGLRLGNSITHLHANRHMRDVLRLKGYEVHYQEYAGGHDYLWWRSTLADGLLALVGREPGE
ncbi:MAG: enterochelin esterase [Chloroflexi bacterium]|nr:MAG: enterochelin esterase [Chloroflexota bacterium]